MRSRSAAIMTATSLAMLALVLPPLSFFSSAGIGLVTLRKGASEGAQVMFGAAIAGTVLGLLVLGNGWVALVFAIMLWLPVYLLALLLRATSHLNWAMVVAAAFGCIAVTLVYLTVSDPAVMWHTRLSEIAEPLLTRAPPEFDVNTFQQRISLGAHFMTGIAATGSVCSAVFALLLGRWWQASLFKPGGFREEFLALRMSAKIALAGIIVYAVAFSSQGLLAEIFLNYGIVLFILFLFVGVAILHTVFSAVKANRLWLGAMYLTMFFVPHILVPIALLGLSDSWLDWRNRFGAGLSL